MAWETLSLNGTEIPDPFPEAVITPFMAWVFLAPGAVAFFLILWFTDWIPLNFDKNNPRERAMLVIMLAMAIGIFVYLLIIQVFQGGVTDRWFPW